MTKNNETKSAAGKSRDASSTANDRVSELANDVIEFARRNPGLAVAAGIGVGILASALLPKNAAGKLARGAAALAAVAGEAGLVLGEQARDAAREGGHKAKGLSTDLAESAEVLARRASRAAAGAGHDVRKAGARLAKDLSSWAKH